LKQNFGIHVSYFFIVHFKKVLSFISCFWLHHVVNLETCEKKHGNKTYMLLTYNHVSLFLFNILYDHPSTFEMGQTFSTCYEFCVPKKTTWMKRRALEFCHLLLHMLSQHLKFCIKILGFQGVRSQVLY